MFMLAPNDMKIIVAKAQVANIAQSQKVQNKNGYNSFILRVMTHNTAPLYNNKPTESRQTFTVKRR